MEWWLLSLYQVSDQEGDGDEGHNSQFQSLKSINVHTPYVIFLNQSSLVLWSIPPTWHVTTGLFAEGLVLYLLLPFETLANC